MRRRLYALLYIRPQRLAQRQTGGQQEAGRKRLESPVDNLGKLPIVPVNPPGWKPPDTVIRNAYESFVKGSKRDGEKAKERYIPEALLQRDLLAGEGRQLCRSTN